MKKTIAQQIANSFDNNGQRFTKNGVELIDILKEKCAQKITSACGEFNKYVFADASSILVFCDCWDIGNNTGDSSFACESFPEG